jgi:16S rRNA U1498 N3-methylase RsmE
LLKVLQKKEGDCFDAGLVQGKLGRGIIQTIGPNRLSFSLILDAEPPPRVPLRLGVGFPRPIQLRRLLRDCATLGFLAVDLICTELGEKSYRDTKLLDDGGAHSALLEGAAQARDTRLPDLAVYPSLAAWLSRRPWERAPGPVVQTPAPAPGDPGGESREKTGGSGGPVRGLDGETGGSDRPFLAAADNLRPGGSFTGLGPVKAGAVLAVGSERGWTGRERELLERAGFVRLSLGRRALRTETACTAAAILLMEKMGVLD